MRLVLVAIVSLFLGAAIDGATRDYLVEQGLQAVTREVDATVKQCEGNYDRLRQILAQQAEARPTVAMCGNEMPDGRTAWWPANGDLCTPQNATLICASKQMPDVSGTRCVPLPKAPPE